MIDQATLALWATDITLLGLAYACGRVHGRYLLEDYYTKRLAELISEVKTMQILVDNLSWRYASEPAKGAK